VTCFSAPLFPERIWIFNISENMANRNEEPGTKKGAVKTFEIKRSVVVVPVLE
jgi:hypothetical protein